MADSIGGTMGQFSDEIEQTATEVSADVKDSVGEAIEAGVQSVAGPQLTPQQQQQKQQQDQAKLAEARNTINFYQDTEANLQKVREENKQNEEQRLKDFEEEMKKKRAKTGQLNPEEKKQQQPLNEAIAATRQEVGKGHGVGG